MIGIMFAAFSCMSKILKCGERERNSLLPILFNASRNAARFAQFTSTAICMRNKVPTLRF